MAGSAESAARAARYRIVVTRSRRGNTASRDNQGGNRDNYEGDLAAGHGRLR
jgi:hypothetical protein